jgi:hypothetical protein
MYSKMSPHITAVASVDIAKNTSVFPCVVGPVNTLAICTMVQQHFFNFQNVSVAMFAGD